MPESLMEMTKSKHKGHLQNPVLLKQKPPKFLCWFDFPVEWLKTSAGCDGSSADKQEWNTWNTQVILHLKTNQVKKKTKNPTTQSLVFPIVKSHKKKQPLNGKGTWILKILCSLHEIKYYFTISHIISSQFLLFHLSGQQLKP